MAMVAQTLNPFLLFLSLILVAQATQAAWDADPVDQKFYPRTRWERRFSSEPDVIATESMNDSIFSCNDVVGPTGYCVVQIADSATREPLWISRPRTKLVGFSGMDPLRSKDWEYTISIESNTFHVVIEDIEFEGHLSTAGIFAIVAYGENINGVIIRGNEIHNYKTGEDAHGIAFWGTGDSNANSIRHILIDSNNVHDMMTGSSESIVVNGNVQRWAIINNTVKDVNNIAIDAIGGEGTAPVKGPPGRVVPGALDAARYGFILNNVVENMSTLNNPKYGNKHSWAAAIYVDGGRRIKISGNKVINAPWAYEVGAENCLTTSHVTISDNEASGSYYGDLLLGGYSEGGYRVAGSTVECDPRISSDSSEGHGYVSRIRVDSTNYFQSCGSGQSASFIDRIFLQYRLTGAVILDTGVAAVNTDRNGRAWGDDNAVLTEVPPEA